MLFHEVRDFLTTDELEVVNKNILSADFSWFYQQQSTSDEFSFFSHVIYARKNSTDYDDYEPISNSTLSHWLRPIVERYCENHLHKELKQIYRSSINLTYGWNLPFDHTEPHVDHIFDHYNLLIYLTDVSYGGETLLFDKYYVENEKCFYSTDEYNQVSILEKIPVEKNKAVCFDGKVFHGVNNFLSNQRRIVLVTTFSV